MSFKQSRQTSRTTRTSQTKQQVDLMAQFQYIIQHMSQYYKTAQAWDSPALRKRANQYHKWAVQTFTQMSDEQKQQITKPYLNAFLVTGTLPAKHPPRKSQASRLYDVIGQLLDSVWQNKTSPSGSSSSPSSTKSSKPVKSEKKIELLDLPDLSRLQHQVADLADRLKHEQQANTKLLLELQLTGSKLAQEEQNHADYTTIQADWQRVSQELKQLQQVNKQLEHDTKTVESFNRELQAQLESKQRALISQHAQLTSETIGHQATIGQQQAQIQQLKQMVQQLQAKPPSNEQQRELNHVKTLLKAQELSYSAATIRVKTAHSMIKSLESQLQRADESNQALVQRIQKQQESYQKFKAKTQAEMDQMILEHQVAMEQALERQKNELTGQHASDMKEWNDEITKMADETMGHLSKDRYALLDCLQQVQDVQDDIGSSKSIVGTMPECVTKLLKHAAQEQM